MNEKLEINGISKNPNKERIFSKIKELQKLPEEVVTEFLKSKGKLAHTNFTRRFKE